MGGLQRDSGLVAVLVHAVYDVVTAWHAARDYNHAHDVRARVTPTVGAEGEQLGLALQGSL